MMEKKIIELINIHKGYEEAGHQRVVLNEVNAEFCAAGFIVIQGRSGSGKTTLLNLIGGIDLPDSGDIRINGQLINRLDEQERTLLRRRKIGFIFQFFNLIPTLTVAENLAFPLELNGVDKKLADARIRQLLEEFSLSDRINAYPDQLSGGEQQRIAIARAVIHTPAIVLADEPTGNLDQETEQEVLRVLQQLPKTHDITLICATHSEEVAGIADEIYQITNGRLIRQ